MESVRLESDEDRGINLMKESGLDRVRGDKADSGMDQSRPTARPHDDDMSAHVIIEATEIENRLRKHILTLMEPAVKRQTLLDIRIKEVNAKCEGQRGAIEELKGMWQGAASVKTQVEECRAELASWDAGRAQFEQQVGDKFGLQESAMTGLRQSFEKRQGIMVGCQRAIKELSEILVKAQEETQSLRRYCADGFETGRDKTTKIQKESEAQHITLDTKINKLQDMITINDSKVDHVRVMIERMDADVGQAVNGVKDLWHSKASVTQVEEQQQEFAEFAQVLNGHVSGLRHQFSGLVSEVKDHFQTAAEVVGASTAKQMEEMRTQYQQAIDRVDKKIQESDVFFEEHRKAEAAMRVDISDVRQGNLQEVATLRESIQKQLHKQQNDHKTNVMELVQLRMNVNSLVANEAEKGGGSLLASDTLAMLAESEFLSALLDMQDDQDRKTVALYGMRPGEGKPPDSPGNSSGKYWTLPELSGGSTSSRRRALSSHEPSPRRRTSVSADTTPGSPVMTLDKRCLSCSGSAATVLAGFKMACLHYNSSPVAYNSTQHSRHELIRLRLDLLKQVREQLAAAAAPMD